MFLWQRRPILIAELVTRLFSSVYFPSRNEEESKQACTCARIKTLSRLHLETRQIDNSYQCLNRCSGENFAGTRDRSHRTPRSQSTIPAGGGKAPGCAIAAAFCFIRTREELLREFARH